MKTLLLELATDEAMFEEFSLDDDASEEDVITELEELETSEEEVELATLELTEEDVTTELEELETTEEDEAELTTEEELDEEETPLSPVTSTPSIRKSSLLLLVSALNRRRNVVLLNPALVNADCADQEPSTLMS